MMEVLAFLMLACMVCMSICAGGIVAGRYKGRARAIVVGAWIGGTIGWWVPFVILGALIERFG